MFDGDALTAPEVAQILGVGKNLVYSMARDGSIASYHIGRKLRFTRAAVDDFIASQATARVTGDTADSIARQGSPYGSQRDPMAGMQPLVIAGSNILADVLCAALPDQGLVVSRLGETCYDALVDLYFGRAHAAVTCIYDCKTNSYNVPAVQRLVPGTPVLVVRLARLNMGACVKRGNPKRIGSWSRMLGGAATIVNRQRGSAERILLDEKIVSLEGRPALVPGYGHEVTSAEALVSLVSKGAADAGICDERAAAVERGVEFVPLQTATVDITVVKSPQTMPLVRALRHLEDHRGVERALADLGFDTSIFGAIAYES